MTWAKTDQADVLTAVRDRLISQITDFNASTCFISPEPTPPKIPGTVHNVFCTVCPQDSQFNEGVFEGAGEDALEENGGVIVTVFTRIRTDRAEHATEALTNTTRGLLKVWKKRVLAALAGFNLTDGTDEILDNLPFPRQCRHFNAPDEGLIAFSLYIDTDFDWDLS